ncbi:uncharacterized protein LOC121373124 [Gigantopelta aegis]|uniref:uncharacterized protein LOC121373124 n=1 Tax=Gigantopelta aegis TaxID=1735272 RepID=UPI001B889DD2|nr:uncharacterized protein LOC121373124 [Gigantopelta aegis]
MIEIQNERKNERKNERTLGPIHGMTIPTQGSDTPTLGPVSGMTISTQGSGTPTLGPVSGMTISTQGSSAPTLGPVSGMTISTQGSGTPTLGPVSGMTISTQGSSTPTLGPVSGMTISTQGSGTLTLGPVSGMTIPTHGSGTPTLGPVSSMTIPTQGSGTLTLGPVSGMTILTHGSDTPTLGPVSSMTIPTQGSGTLTLGPFSVLADLNNVALNKPASQNSHYEYNKTPPSNGVDGNYPDNVYDVTMCILTDVFQDNSWWEVDLGKPHYIYDVTVHFRMDYPYRRNGVHVYSSLYRNQINTGHLCGAATVNSPNVTRITCDTTVQYITLYQGTDNTDLDTKYQSAGTAMDFCEVEVFICDAGTFGGNCTEFCHCQGQPCNYVTGECVGGCKQNWTGTQCSVCDSDHYGSLCNASCSNRHCDQTNGISRCDNTDGQCNNGCETGWTGTSCTQKCPVDRYGHGCNQLCSERHCLGETSCNHVTGECDHGCDRGYILSDCTKACPPGTFGSGCTLRCRERHCDEDSTTCDAQSGTCKNGCTPGWKKPSCMEPCDTGLYGANCGFTCTRRHCLNKAASCNHVTGSCGGECEQSWMGVDCTEISQKDSGSTNVPMAAALGIVSIMLVAVSGAFFWYVRRHRPPLRSAAKENIDVANEDGRHYEIVDRQTGQERDMARNDVPQRPLGDIHQSGNVNAGQDIQLNEYEHLDPLQSPQNVYDKITGM